MTPIGQSHWEGDPVRVLEREWGLARLEVYDEIGSTNDRIRELAATGTQAPAMVISSRQSAGRGRNGRSWAAPLGGLWTSFLLDIPIARAPWIPLAAGTAVAQAIESVSSGVRVDIKWPNDLVVEGGKLCGILCEAAGGERVVVGIGVNVAVHARDLPPEVRETAVSLGALSRSHVSMGKLADAIVRNITEIGVGPDGTMPAETIAELRARDVLFGRRVRASSGPVVGIGRGIDARGGLILENSQGVRSSITNGSVELLSEDVGPDAD